MKSTTSHFLKLKMACKHNFFHLQPVVLISDLNHERFVIVEGDVVLKLTVL